ncbi:MAG TPA: GNAT family N-acetyltransferase [Thermoanaerobaculia bacterium]|nr:GNAT family N-acetyltransferase [Thermoanaerobaculia bacterium]
MTQKQVSVEHNQARSRFEATVDGRLAEAGYQLRPGQIVFTHTSVPKELEGRGIAGEIVRAGLDYARGEKLGVVAECSYVSRFIERHPEYQDLLSKTS